jgi:hypothetical protein
LESNWNIRTARGVYVAGIDASRIGVCRGYDNDPVTTITTYRTSADRARGPGYSSFEIADDVAFATRWMPVCTIYRIN